MHNPELIACAGEAPRSKRQVQEFAGLSAFASLSAVFAAVCGGVPQVMPLVTMLGATNH